jgi:predicted PurR-regulated permease PerM
MSGTIKKLSPLEILNYIISVSLILYFGRVLFIPLFLGLFISFIVFPISAWLISKKLPSYLAYSLPVLLLFTGLIFLFYYLVLQILDFPDIWANLRIKIIEAYGWVSEKIAINLDYSRQSQKVFIDNLLDESGGKVITFLRSLVSSISESLFTFLMAPIFAILILFYNKLLSNSLFTLFSSNQKETLRQILLDTVLTYYNFIKGMSLVYLSVGLLNSIGLYLIGIPHPILFGFLASILTFIPYIGIMMASILPISVAWVTYDSILYPLYVILVFAIVQTLEAYLLFPFIVGNRLKINTLAIFTAIVIGGIIWGAVGMILFIPLISILKIVSDRSPKMKSISLLLSNGKD